MRVFLFSLLAVPVGAFCAQHPVDMPDSFYFGYTYAVGSYATGDHGIFYYDAERPRLFVWDVATDQYQADDVQDYFTLQGARETLFPDGKAVSLALSVNDVRYCLLFLIGVTLYSVGAMAWGRWHKG